MDYINIVINIFNEEERKYYDIERLWADGKIKEVDDGGLLWSQNLATSLITESETHPLGAKDGDRKSFNSRLIDYNSTVLDLIRRVDPLPKPRTSPTQSLGSNVKIGDSKGWSVSLITINN